MCNVCLQSPCDPRCPGAEEPKVYTHCEICGGEIYEGDEFYDVLDFKVCEACMHDSRKYAED